MKKGLLLLCLLGSCCKGELKIDYVKEGSEKPKFEMHVDFSAEDESITSPPPTLDTVIKKQVYAF